MCVYDEAREIVKGDAGGVKILWNSGNPLPLKQNHCAGHMHSIFVVVLL